MPGRIDVIAPDGKAARVVLEDLPADDRDPTAQNVTLHVGQKQTIRVVDELQTISGNLELPDGLDGTLEGATVQVHASDGKSQFSKSVVTSKYGEFELQGIGERVVVFAMLADKRASGFVFCNNRSG